MMQTCNKLKLCSVTIPNSSISQRAVATVHSLFSNLKIRTFRMLPMKITKGLCNFQWVIVVLYAVYLHLSFTETVIEHDKCMLNTAG